uniref:Major facilitator superfamily (MFS) profile domain-containing protein n=1 Tax=Ditylenchus dipsaci TaxID=166011 RepID=A0A915DC89_9BILA
MKQQKNGLLPAISLSIAQEDGTVVVRKHPLFHPCSRRLHVMLLIMLGYFSIVFMRTNLGMAMTCMVNSTAITLNSIPDLDSVDLLVTPVSNLSSQDPASSADKCPHLIEQNENGVTATFVNDYGGSLVWDTNIQSWLFSASFYGSLLSCLPAGILADRWSPKHLLQLTCLLSICCSCLMPYFSTNFGYGAVFGLRFVMGLGEGFIMPSFNKMISQWIPTEEMSTALSIHTTGNQMAGAVGVPLAAFLCGTIYGWPSIFYVCALLGAICSRIENFNEYKTAANNKSTKVDLIKTVQPGIPYKQMLKSPALLSLLFCAFSTNLIVVLIQVYLPSFFKEVLLLSMINNGLFSAAPNIAQLVAKISWSVLMDKLKEKHISSTFACKFSQGFSSVSVSTLFILLAHYSGCETQWLSLSLVCLLCMAFATSISGFYTSLLKLAPSYTGILTSIFMLAGFAGRLITPRMVAFFNKTGSLSEWRLVFYTMAATTLFSGVFFLVFGSGETQNWDKPKQDDDTPSPVGAQQGEQEVMMVRTPVTPPKRRTNEWAVCFSILLIDIPHFLLYSLKKPHFLRQFKKAS